MSQEEQVLYEFGAFVLDPMRRLLLHQSQPVALTSKAFDTLLVLVERRGEVLDKDELMERVWRGVIVEENNLNQCISALRKALGETPGDNHYIVTIPGRGYRFVAAVQRRAMTNGVETGGAEAASGFDGSGSAPAGIVPLASEVLDSHESTAAEPGRATMGAAHFGRRVRLGAWILLGVAAVLIAYLELGQHRRPIPSPAAAAPLPRRSVAVLGFENLSQRPESAWLSTALAEMLTSDLGAGGNLRTIPGESVERAKVELSLHDADGLSQDTLARVRHDLGSDVVVTGAYTVLGGQPEQVRLDVRAQNAATGETLATLSETGAEDALFDLVSRAGERLRATLGVEKPSFGDAGQMKAAAPSNPQAARVYAEGLAKLRSFDALAAESLLEKAVAADPSYPLAHAELAEVLNTLGYQERASAEAKRALDLSAGLSRERQLAIEGRYYDLAANHEKAIEAYRALVSFFPDNVDYGLRLADAQTGGGEAHQALQTLAALRKLPPPLRDDPRIALAEARADGALSDMKGVAAAAHRAAEQAQTRGARWLYAQARSAEAGVMGSYNLPAALTAAEEARQICAELGDQACVALYYRRIGINKVGSDPQGAEQSFREALRIARQIGNRDEESNDLNGIAAVLTNQGDLAGGDRIYRQLLTASRHDDNKWDIQMFLNNLGEDLLLEGNLAEALKMEQEGLAVSRASGQKVGIAEESADVARILELQGDLPGADRYWQEALTASRQEPSEFDIGNCLSGLAELAWYRGDEAAARTGYDQALTHLKTVSDEVDAAAAKLALARLELDDRQPAQAVAWARTAAETLQQRKRPDEEARARAVLAEALLAANKPDEARSELNRAMALVSHSQAQLARVEVGIAAALVRTGLSRYSAGSVQESVRSLDELAAEAQRRGETLFDLQARLAEGEIEMRSGQHTAGRTALESVAHDAQSRGFVYLARQAQASM